MKYTFFVFLLFFNTIFLFAQVERKMDGTVVNETGLPISGVKVVIDKGAPIISGQDGEFHFLLKDKDQPNTVEVFKQGYAITSWGIKSHELPGDAGDTDYLQITLKQTSYHWGHVKDKQGNKLGFATVELKKLENGSTAFAKANADGYFIIDIHAASPIVPETEFYVNGELVYLTTDRKINATYKSIELVYTPPKKVEVISKEDSTEITEGKEVAKTGEDTANTKVKKIPTEELTFTVYLMDDTAPLDYSEIYIKGKRYRANSAGIIKVKGEFPKMEDFKALEGYAIKVDPNEKVKAIYVQITRALTEGLDTLQNTDEIAEEYREEMNRIIKGLEYEKSILTVKAVELRKQIARLADRLGNEHNLTSSQRNGLKNTLERLEQTLEQNDEAYRRAQEKTKEAINKMKDVLAMSEAKRDEIASQARRERLILLMLLLGVGAVAFAFFMIGRKVRKQKDELEEVKSDLEDKVEEIKVKNEKILAQTDSLKALNHAVTAKNEKITDSIYYAKTIQEAILPSKLVMDAALDDYFIYYEPKAIVSGDFYWFSEIETKGQRKMLVAAVDCTGHGVPGGFMSMIGNTLLNEIINEKKIVEPSKILSQLNAGIKTALKQDKKLNADGMDVCLCVMEEADGQIKVEFSGAKRPLFYLNPQKAEVGYLKGHPQSLGGMKQKAPVFQHQEVFLQKGDIIYLTSDGLMAQGDAKLGKIGTNGFKQFLKSNAEKSLAKQKEALVTLLEDYQINSYQRDDILVFAIKL